MNSSEVQAEFLLRFYEEEVTLIGARWWNEAFEQSASMPRRSVAFWAAAGVDSILTLRFAECALATPRRGARASH